MKYMGSKNRIAKFIIPIMLNEASKQEITKWVEPFVGGGNSIDKVPNTFERYGVDINPHVIFALKDIRDNVDKLPNEITEKEYNRYKGTPPSSITSWVRFVASFGGIFENAYAREEGSDDTTFCGYGKRNALKQSPKLQGVKLDCCSYDSLEIENSLIYCDPPYKGTTSYKTEVFNHNAFYEWCEKQVKYGNIVFVSEYSAPEHWECVWEGQIKTNFASSRKTATHNATEKLFKVKLK